MPILDNGSIHYEMPEKYKAMIDSTFCKNFLRELHLIWGFSLEDFNWESIGYCEGTSGWYVAFTNTCRTMQLDELFLYYRNLPWYDSDLFDAQLSDRLVEEKLVLPELYIVEAARQNNLNIEDIDNCEYCGKIGLKSEMILSTEPEDEHDEPLYVCPTCATGIDFNEITLNIKRALTELLNKNNEDYFVCEKCGKIHLNQHKGNKYCLHCEQEIVPDTNVTVYYKKSLDECDEYRDNLVNRS